MFSLQFSGSMSSAPPSLHPIRMYDIIAGRYQILEYLGSSRATVNGGRVSPCIAPASCFSSHLLRHCLWQQDIIKFGWSQSLSFCNRTVINTMFQKHTGKKCSKMVVTSSPVTAAFSRAVQCVDLGQAFFLCRPRRGERCSLTLNHIPH